VDYLVWQDSQISQKCGRFKGTKCMPIRKRSRVSCLNYNTTYFFGFGKYRPKKQEHPTFELSNSGCVAFQLAHYMGFETIILVGCDCAVLTVIDEHGDKTLRSNVFKDRVSDKAFRRGHRGYLRQVVAGGNRYYTTSSLQGFSSKWMELYRRFKEDVDIYKLGNFGILEIPVIEYPQFYSEEHPDVSKRERRRRHESQ
jgi:hypothetical protein